MNKKNFNSISQFSVPQNWIDNALNIPNEKNKKKPILFIKHFRTLAAVAGFIIVCCVSLMLFLLTEDNAKPTIKPTQSVSPTYHSDVITESINNNGVSENNGEINEGFIEPTEDPQIENQSSNSGHQPTKPSIKPTEDIIGPTQKPTIEPTEKSTISPTKPIAPTEPTEPWDPPPTESETESDTPPWVDPTEPQSPTEPIEPTSSTEKPSINVIASTTIDKELLNGETEIYCKVYDQNGNLCGDQNLYSSQHKATIIPRTDGDVTLYYSISRNILGKSGYYRFVFYNSSGTYMTECTVYVS